MTLKYNKIMNDKKMPRIQTCRIVISAILSYFLQLLTFMTPLIAISTAITHGFYITGKAGHQRLSRGVITI